MFRQIDYTMVIVSDMARSVEFYRDKLGIPLKFESPDWTEFLTGTTTLALNLLSSPWFYKHFSIAGR
jgi:lactoylglutathione lyase